MQVFWKKKGTICEVTPVKLLALAQKSYIALALCYSINMDNYFFKTKIRYATKIVKNQEAYFGFALMNAAHCIREQNKKGGGQ